MKPLRAFLLPVLISSLLFAGQNSNQNITARQKPPTFRVASNLVVVDATVRDKKGNLIADLRKENFTIYEDKVPQEIVLFSLENIPAMAADAVAEVSPEIPKPPAINLTGIPPAERKMEELADKRLIILFFDLSSLDTEDQIRSVDAAAEFVAKKSTPNDLIAVATYGSALQIPQDFTNDRDILLKALRRISPTEAGDAPAEDLGDQDTSDELFVPDSVQFNIFNTDRRLAAIENLAKAYREFPERKSLIYFSSGITTTGIENQSQIRSTVDTANQSNMTIYTVDSRGLAALPPAGGASRGSPGGRALFSGSAMRQQVSSFSGSQETLTTLAQDTGGTSFQDANELAPVFSKVISDTQSYYIIGYYSSNPKQDGKFRKLEVAVNRPDVRIQHRPGYFASKQFSRMTQAERDRQLEEAFNVDRPFTDLPFILEADYFKADGTTSLMPVSLQLAGDGVQFEEKGNRREAQFEFLAHIADPKGRVAGLARDTVQVRLPIPSAEKIRTGQILYTTGFQLRPGDYKLKFLIRDNRSGKLGSFEQSLVVPVLDAKKLQTSSVIVGSRLVSTKEDSQGVEHRGFGDRFRLPASNPDPLVINDRRIVPSIGNVFLNRQTLYVYFQVYGAADGPLNKKPSLETYLLLLQNKTKVRESQPHRVEEWNKDGKGIATVSMAVPLRGLKRGSYTLQIHLRDSVSDTNLFRRVPVVIE